MNKFDQLVEDLEDGSLGLIHIQNAIRAYVRQRKDIPEGVKDLLSGGPVLGGTSSGLIYHMFNLMRQVIGSMELAYRRGEQKDK